MTGTVTIENHPPAPSGDAWFTVPGVGMFWGRYGAAGLLLRHAPTDGPERFLLALRAARSDAGGTWGLPGGARHSHEPAWAAAWREATEEIVGLPASAVMIGEHEHAVGGWTYTTLVGDVTASPHVLPATWEHEHAGWFTRDEVAGLRLHPGLAAAWPILMAMIDGPPPGPNGVNALMAAYLDRFVVTAGPCQGCGHHHVTDPPRCAETLCTVDCPECADA